MRSLRVVRTLLTAGILAGLVAALNVAVALGVDTGGGTFP